MNDKPTVAPGVFAPKPCPKCGCDHDEDRREKLYPMQIAAEIVPFPTVSACRQFFYEHKAQLSAPLYKKHHGTYIRMIPESDIFKCRQILFSTKPPMLRLVKSTE